MTVQNNKADFVLSEDEIKRLYNGIYARADRLTERVLVLMFAFGVFLGFFYDTWLIAFGVGGLCLLAYFFSKMIFPGSNLYQYVLSAVSAIFAAQYIYQMHGLAEMHFWVFISATILIIYQNWKLQIPLIVIVILHHGSFAYLQYIGYQEIYFTQLAYMDLTAFLFHGVLASCVSLVAAIWSDNVYKRTIHDARNLKVMTELKAELQSKNEELKTSEEKLSGLLHNRTQVIMDQNKKLVDYAFVSAHKVRSPLARILGLVNLIGLEIKLSDRGKELNTHLSNSAIELDEILREVRHNLRETDVNDDEG